MNSQESAIKLSGQPTPTINTIPLRYADFANLAEALDYAATGTTGANFYAGGKLATVLTYAELREQATALACKLASLKLPRGSCIAIVGETAPYFLRFFFACQYMGLVPVALPASINLGGHAAYVEKLKGMLTSCGARVAVCSESFAGFLGEASESLDLVMQGTPEVFDELAPVDISEITPTQPDEISYMQFTSGSTGFPKSAMIKAHALMANIQGSVKSGVQMVEDDRFSSWLPFYHDMGLIGCLLTVVSSQRSIDYLDTREFAMRPRRWLELMHQNKGTVAYAPPFGYDLCARRVRPSDVENYDLSHWRVAGVGAEPIHPSVLDSFAETFEPTGFRKDSFVPSYGMAENTLAISFSPLREGVKVDWIDPDDLTDNLKVTPVAKGTGRGFVRCGKPMPHHKIKIVNDDDVELSEKEVGRILIHGPSLMTGYYKRPEETAKVLFEDNWYDTGDVGYLVDGEVVITGRHKDMIIINGRNIWPQDIEAIAEKQLKVRTRDASAFGLTQEDGTEVAVVVVQTNMLHTEENKVLEAQIRRQVYEELGVVCLVELVPRHTLPRTSSGKLSRSATRIGYLERLAQKEGDGSSRKAAV
ncbi:2-succinylbenzoate--CoA ligase [Halomonadaceae bacterium LMG 33818]|uniref:fatty acyl-AMP ligase n=1 Tax=Cernens ardua TaxID=3402176 RepID=UPI003EDBFB50